MTRRPTEDRNPATVDIDLMPAADAVDAILAEDANAIVAARRAVPGLVLAIEGAADRLAAGGRLHYFGAGASGRLAVLDATELTPTFGVARDLVQAHFPGGVDALIDSSRDFEDADALGADDATAMTAADVAFGVTASGTTPYVAGALNVGAGRRRLHGPAHLQSGPGYLRRRGHRASTPGRGDHRIHATQGGYRDQGRPERVLVGIDDPDGADLLALHDRHVGHERQAARASGATAGRRERRPPSAAREAWDFADGDTAVALAALLSGATVDEARIALDATRSVRAAVARIEADR